MLERLVRKLAHYGPVRPDELDGLERIMTPPRVFARGEEIIRQFSSPRESTLVLAGLAGRRVTMEDGAAQVTALHTPGDFVDLHSFVVAPLDHSIVALADCRVTTAPHEALRLLTERFPRLARALWFLTLLDAAIHRQWLVMIGRRDALERMAHLLCEMNLRLADVGLAAGGRFELPLTQAEVADVLSLSTVHVNRVLQELRRMGLVAWTQGRVEILDGRELARLAQFDPTYLQLN
jgi:CRP-like cAMP-binding protein